MEKPDLLKAVTFEGCSAKLPAKELQKALGDFHIHTNENMLVDVSTHDDGGVYKINENQALIQTTDFFPPVCSDPYEFGQIAAANALSDVFAMGGQVLTALNLVMYPVTLPLSSLPDILKGGQDKVVECGGVIAGGHTITDDSLKYGMAVTGLVHPDKIVTNAGAKVGDKLILTKPIGTGVVIAAKKIKQVDDTIYQSALDSMKKLNQKAAVIMQKYHVKSGTDITGFGLAGHLHKMASASGVSMQLHIKSIPVFDRVYELLELGCIPGAAFRNLEFLESNLSISDNISYEEKMLAVDAQTSGGIVMAVSKEHAEQALKELLSDHPEAAIIGEVVEKGDAGVVLV